MLAGGLESIEPLLVFVFGHDGYIVPVAMGGERKEIQMALGDLVAAPQRSLAVPDGIVVVQITPVNLPRLRRAIPGIA